MQPMYLFPNISANIQRLTDIKHFLLLIPFTFHLKISINTNLEIITIIWYKDKITTT